MGDIGEKQTEVEFEPLDHPAVPEPATAPSTPVEVPETVPA